MKGGRRSVSSEATDGQGNPAVSLWRTVVATALPNVYVYSYVYLSQKGFKECPMPMCVYALDPDNKYCDRFGCLGCWGVSFGFWVGR